MEKVLIQNEQLCLKRSLKTALLTRKLYKFSLFLEFLTQKILSTTALQIQQKHNMKLTVLQKQNKQTKKNLEYFLFQTYKLSIFYGFIGFMLEVCLYYKT